MIKKKSYKMRPEDERKYTKAPLAKIKTKRRAKNKMARKTKQQQRRRQK